MNRSVLTGLSRVSIMLITISLLLVACSQSPEKASSRPPLRGDFSGNWEMDYSLNDSVEARLENYFYRLRKAMARKNNQSGGERSSGLSVGGSRVASTVFSMARFVEQISRTVVLDIEQTYNAIHIDREDTFSLDCYFGENGLHVYENMFGEEICGWDGHQLIFQLSLPEGLKVQHRLTLSSDGEQLNIATTLISDKAPEPFTLNRAYMRFEKSPERFRCEQTVTRGKVCTLSSSEDQSDLAGDEL